MNSITRYTTRACDVPWSIGTNIKKTLTDWVENQKKESGKQIQLGYINKILQNAELSNPFVKKLIADLARDYKYKRYELEDYFDTYRGRENLSNITWEILQDYKYKK